MPDASTIERIEVLRGPAAMLYGRSDPGGTFNIVSKQPQVSAAPCWAARSTAKACVAALWTPLVRWTSRPTSPTA